MNRIESRRNVPNTHRTRRPSLSPYYMDETAFTLADIRRDPRAGHIVRQGLREPVPSEALLHC